MTRGMTSEVYVYISLNVLILYFDPPASENTDRHEVQVKIHVTVQITSSQATNTGYVDK